MNCPVCKETVLVLYGLESNLASMHCQQCGGHWIQSFQYWRWRDMQGRDLPELSASEGEQPAVGEPGGAKFCPECRRYLGRYKVGRGFEFSLDRCEHCGGVWFDCHEWESLKSRNLHDDVHFIFSQAWQAAVQRETREKERQKVWTEILGVEDYAEVNRIKSWLESHPRKPELYAFLMEGIKLGR